MRRRERTKELVPQFNESKARRLGISKQEVSETLQMAFGGTPIGLLAMDMPFSFTAFLGLLSLSGMIPLVFDAFFGSMAITIMAGLGFATVLTLIVVPVLFAILYRIKPSTAG